MDDLQASDHNGDFTAAIRSMGSLSTGIDELEMPSDPDAQATITDFLDFTEYLPSDMTRSLTLIKGLDKQYHEASALVHQTATLYGKLPEIPIDSRPTAESLRWKMAQNMNDVLNARMLSHAEAARMADSVDRHYNRAKTILGKLRDMAAAYPPSREASPSGHIMMSPQAARAPKIKIRLDGGRPVLDASLGHSSRRRVPRIIVPGEVLAPYEFDYDTFDSATDVSDSDELLASGQMPGTTIKIKSMKPGKLSSGRIPKQPRPPRPPGVMGTNVHSAIAGISTSNALAKLKPPPENAQPGSSDAPWLQLTAWELAKLRKRMKKNAVWSPSDTMIARELKHLGRGIEAYRRAKQDADTMGLQFDLAPPSAEDSSGNLLPAEGAISADALAKADIQLSNRGMKLNEAKKLKRELQAKELAKLAAEEVEQATRNLADLSHGAINGIFAKPATKENGIQLSMQTIAKTPKQRSNKRKRETTVDSEKFKVEQEITTPHDHIVKRPKMETPVPAPPSAASQALLTKAASMGEAYSAPDSANTSVSGATVVTTTTSAPGRAMSPLKLSTPILPPAKDKKESKKEVKAPSLILSTTRSQASRPPSSTPPPQSSYNRRPPSRSKAASAEPVSLVGKDRPRRASTAHNTPAPEALAARPPSRRGKRPAPGPVTAGSEGSTAVSVGRRTAATRKKAGQRKHLRAEEKEGAGTEVWDEIDDEGNIIDPNEPRYCICNRVSFGLMICCESKECEKEWFHLECVGLTEVPPRTTKWYCPDCRIKLGIGEKGEVSARGRKK